MRRSLGVVALTLLLIPALSFSKGIPIRWVTRGPPDSPFITITGADATTDGEIWVSDTRANTIYIFDEQGQFLRRLGRSGDGPGEFRGPTYLSSMASNRMAVLDLGRKSIEVFDQNGVFLHRVGYGIQVFNPKGFLALRDSTFLITGGILGKPGSVHRISWDGELIASGVLRPVTVDSLASVYISGGPVARLAGDLIVFSSASEHQVSTISLADMKVRVLAEEDGVFPRIGDDFIQQEPGQHVRRYRWFFPRPTGLFVLADGSLLNVITWRDRDLSIWERFRRTGDLISRIEAPTAFVPWALLPGGDMLVSRTLEDTGEVELLRIGPFWMN